MHIKIDNLVHTKPMLQQIYIMGVHCIINTHCTLADITRGDIIMCSFFLFLTVASPECQWAAEYYSRIDFAVLDLDIHSR